MFNNLRDARAQIETLGKQATDLTARAEKAESRVTELEGEITSLKSKDVEESVQVKELTARAELAEKQALDLTAELDKAKSEVTDFEKKVADAAAIRATSQVAAAGHPPIEGDAAGGKPGSATDSVTKDNFWDKYKEQPVTSRQAWYDANKKAIGR